MRAVKFGGTSVANAERLVQVAQLVARHAAEGPVLVVVSAQAGVTDRLVTAYEQALVGELKVENLRGELGARHLSTLERLKLLTPYLDDADFRQVAAVLHRRLLELVSDLAAVKELAGRGSRRAAARRDELKARILATGERLSAPLAAAALRGWGMGARAIDAAEVLVAQGPLLDADPDLPATAALLRPFLAELPPGIIPVFTGFLGRGAQGEVALLGRGGSDTSATVLAAAAGAGRVDIYTDVDGILTADPRKDPNAVLLPFLTYAEAFALAAKGAKVLHPKAVEPAEQAGIPIVVRNTFKPDHPGTFVAATPKLEEAVA